MRPAASAGPQAPSSDSLRYRPVDNFEKRANELGIQLREAQRRNRELEDKYIKTEDKYRQVRDLLNQCDEDHMNDLKRLEDTEEAHNQCTTRLREVLKDREKNNALQKENGFLKERVAQLEQKLVDSDELRKQEKRELASELEKKYKDYVERAKAAVALPLGEANGALAKRNDELKSIINQYKIEKASHINTETELRSQLDNKDRDLRASRRAVGTLKRQLEEKGTGNNNNQGEVSALSQRNERMKDMLEEQIRKYDELYKASNDQAIAYQNLKDAYQEMNKIAQVSGGNILNLQAQIAELAVRLSMMRDAMPDKERANQIMELKLPDPMKRLKEEYEKKNKK